MKTSYPGVTGSPAVRLLQANGVSVHELAEVVNRDPSSVSRWFSGYTRRLPGELHSILSELIGDEAATEVISSIPTLVAQQRAAGVN